MTSSYSYIDQNENLDIESNSETEFDDKTAEVDEDNTAVNFETDAEADKEFIPFKMKIQMWYVPNNPS